MRTLVDTCVLSEVRHPKGNPRVRERFEAISDDSIYLSVITVGEITRGIGKLAAGPKRQTLQTWLEALTSAAGGRILPIDVETAVIWGEITVKSERAGQPLPTSDGLIAATAIRHGLHLMTRNVRDFESSGVMLINPWTDSAT